MGNIDAQPDWNRFVKHAMSHGIPLNMHWDLTWRCDHKCVHCYLTDRRQDELTLEESVDILDQLAEAGTLSILFSGGDPFLRPEAVEIMRAARDRDFDVRINTHGNFIDEVLADALAEMCVAKVSLSVYSAHPEDHDAVTLIPGSHAKTLAAARRLIARDINVTLKTPVMVQNRHSYDTVRGLADEMGALWELDASIVPDDQSDFGLCSIGVHESERALAIMHQAADIQGPIPHWTEIPEASLTSRTCAAGASSGYISPDGWVYPCINWRDRVGNLRDARFIDLWTNSEAIQRQRQITRASYDDDCGGCSFQNKCSYCPGISHAEHGDPGRRSAYVCERTHVSMTAFEHLHNLSETGEPVPLPGTPEAVELLSGSTFAERQWAARRTGAARPGDQLRPNLIQITEPSNL